MQRHGNTEGKKKWNAVKSRDTDKTEKREERKSILISSGRSVTATVKLEEERRESKKQTKNERNVT